MVLIYDSCFHCLKQSHLWKTLVRILSNCVVSFLVLKTIWTRIRSDKFCWQHALLKMKGSSFNKSGLWAESLSIYHHYLFENIFQLWNRNWSKLSRKDFCLAMPAKIGQISVLVTANSWKHRWSMAAAVAASLWTNYTQSKSAFLYLCDILFFDKSPVCAF